MAATESIPMRSFRALPMTSVAATGAMEEWLNAAPPGDTAIYATGAEPPRDSEGIKLVRQWVARGLVTTNQCRDPDDERRWQFLMTKRGGTTAALHESQETGGQCPRSPAAPVGGEIPQPVQRAADRSDLRKLLSTLRSCAERGLPCPSLSAIADELGLAIGERGRQRAAHLMRRLEREGSIDVQRRGNQAPPVVTIRAAGRSRGKSTLDQRARA